MPLATSVQTRRALVATLTLSLLAGFATAAPVAASTAVFINEIHYDNDGTDAGEAIEIAGPAGTDLTGWSIVLYNGSGGAPYDTDALGGIIPNQQNGMGTVVITYPVNGIQNGSPDGIALVNGATVVQFLSYEGQFTAVGGPANGMTSTNIGVSETSSEPLGRSLQLQGAGLAYESFTWAAPGTSTFGAVNTNQAFSAVSPVIAVCGSTLTAAAGYPATRQVTASDADGVVTSIVIDDVSPDPTPGSITIGLTTPAPAGGGTASALVTVDDATPAGTYTVRIVASNDDPEPQTDDCILTVTVSNILTIGAVQGSVSDTDDGASHRSTFAPPTGNGTGQTVFVHGLVTQRTLARTAGGASQFGIFLQNTAATRDADANSSDGIFVFMGAFPDILRLYGGANYVPAVGDEIVLRASVVEFFSLTELSSPRLVATTGTGIDIGTAIDAIEADPADLLADANRFWERHEGMRFHVDANSHVVAARDVFPSTADGEVWVIRGDHPIVSRSNPYERLVYRDTHPLDDIGPAGSFDNGNGMRILLTSHGLKALGALDTLIAPARTYDTITNELTGGLTFAFSKYSIEVEQQPLLVNGVDPALNAPPAAAQAGVEFATSDYNVENLYDYRDDPFDPCDFVGGANTGCPGVNPPFDYVPASVEVYEAHLTDLARQIAGPMHAPDLLMIQEAEDQDLCWVEAASLTCDLSGDPGTDNADGKADTLQELALAISAAGGPSYDVAYDRDGADDRGIVSAFVYRTDTVELLPADASDPVLGSSPTVVYRGEPLAYNTDVSNPKALNADLPDDVNLDTGFDGTDVYTRAPQVGHFRVWRDGIGSSVFTDLYALSNHFSSTPNARVGQRTEQALYNAAIIKALEAAEADRVISAGDFNVFPRPDDPFAPGELWACNPMPCSVGQSDQLAPMYDAGLNNLWDTLVAEVPASAYSYNFVGMVQTLDMQWATDGQFADLVQVRAGHFNVDFAADYDGDTARGASDHDPQLARWFTDVTFDRLRALVDYYVASGDLPEAQEFLFDNRLDKAEAYLQQGKVVAAKSQLMAFGNQAFDYATPAAAAAMKKEADRLASQL
jgi:predicted extracellular nuclease